MASSSRQSAASGQSFVGSHSFSPGKQTQIEEADSVHSKLKGVLASLRQGASPGKDNATSAGYDPTDRNRIAALLRDIKTTSKRTDRIKGDILTAKMAIRERAKRPLLGIDSGDEEARQKASSRVVELVAGSADNMHLFFRGLRVPVDPGMDDTLKRALRELPVSGQVPTQRPDGSEELASAQKNAKMYQDRLVGVSHTNAKLQKAWESASKKCDELSEQVLRQSHDISKTKNDLEKADKGLRYVKDQCRSARHDVESRDASLRESKQRIQSLEEQVRTLRVDLQGRNDDVSQMNRDYSALQEQLKESRRCASAAETQLQRLRSDVESSRDSHAAEVEGLKRDKRDLEREADQLRRDLKRSETNHEETRRQLVDAQLKNSEGNGRLISATEEVGKVKEDHRKLKGRADSLQAELEEKGQRVQELESASRQKDSIIAQRDETIESQVQKAATFLRHLSVDVESDTWKLVAGNVLADSACTSITSAAWLPWVILPSWSSDVSLDIRQDARSPEAVALAVLAILDSKLADTRDLLTSLHRLQASMGEAKSMVSSITQLIVRAFTDSVGDPRLHIMHRISMCQIIHTLARADEALLFTQASNAVDSRVQRLVNALTAYRLDTSVLPMTEAISYPGVALIGFSREPRGVIAVRPDDNGICWVEASHIRITFKTIKMQSGVGSFIDLPLDSPQRLSWAMTHV
jgi:hypothetical protein